MNGVLLQTFEWYLVDDGKHYINIKNDLKHIKDLGITAIWLPPVFKGLGTNDVGYGIYDLYDLGEFNQKGTIRTKYGTKHELLDLINEAHVLGLSVYSDVVLNHKAGADETEEFMAVEVSNDNRNYDLSKKEKIKGWTKFLFKERNNKYSSFKWNYNHFSGVDYDEIKKKKGIYRIVGKDKGWSWAVSSEHGNYDYLMFSDIDHNNQEVKDELFSWAKWFINETKVDGFRYDAIKHIDANFIDELNKYILKNTNNKFYSVGEYWVSDKDKLKQYIDETTGKIDLFDVQLHFNFQQASLNPDYDLRTIFDNTIVKYNPVMSVSFVDNHDTQKGQSLQSWVDDWFRQIAYSLILLRKDGYPCVFYGDYNKIGDGKSYNGMKDKLEKLLLLRKSYAYGSQDDYFDDPSCIGFVRNGDENNKNKLAVIISSKDINEKRMFIGKEESNNTYIDYLGNNLEEVIIDEEGFGIFPVSAGSVSGWINKKSL